MEVNLTPIIEESFIQYAAAVTQSRALVDVRDCIKPSARQIFYSMLRNKYTWDKPHEKTLAPAGDAGKEFYIHGDASLVGIIGIVAVINMILGFAGIRLEQIFSYIFAPFGFLMGLDTNQVLMEGAFLGNKLIVNEFVAFQDLGKILSSLDYRTGIVCSISLCGFANLSSLGICVSGIAVLCPEKKSTLSRLVFRAMLGGVFVSILSAMIVGLITLF